MCMRNSTMRFIVLGAGAIGGVVGGRLFEHGYDVVLVARGAHYDALSQNGLRLESPEKTVTLPIPTVPDPGEITFEDGDIVLLAVKSQDTIPAVHALAAAAPDTLPVVCAQNGVENERVVLRRFSHVYGMAVMCPAAYRVPGVVQAHSVPVTGMLDLGRWPSGIDDMTRTVADALKASTFSSDVRADIARWKWGRLVVNLGLAVEALCGAKARGGEITRRAQEEAVACFEAGGIDYVQAEEDAERRGDILRPQPIDGLPRAGGSSWQSLARSSGAIETDFLNGEIVLLGRLHGVPVPVNETLERLTNRHARDRFAPGSMAEDDFLRLLE